MTSTNEHSIQCMCFFFKSQLLSPRDIKHVVGRRQFCYNRIQSETRGKTVLYELKYPPNIPVVKPSLT